MLQITVRHRRCNNSIRFVIGQIFQMCTLGIAAGLVGLPVHGSLDGFLPASVAELALCL